MNWKDSFNPQALSRGWRLYKQGMVSGIQRKGDLYFAAVMDPYTGRRNIVQARIEDGNVISISCSGERAGRNDLCAHEAAFLYALEDLPLPDPQPKKPDALREEVQNSASLETDPNRDS